MGTDIRQAIGITGFVFAEEQWFVEYSGQERKGMKGLRGFDGSCISRIMPESSENPVGSAVKPLPVPVKGCRKGIRFPDVRIYE